MHLQLYFRLVRNNFHIFPPVAQLLFKIFVEQMLGVSVVLAEIPDTLFLLLLTIGGLSYPVRAKIHRSDYQSYVCSRPIQVTEAMFVVGPAAVEINVAIQSLLEHFCWISQLKRIKKKIKIN